jgi:hypothetical protein
MQQAHGIKVIVLTRGDLSNTLGMFFFQNRQPKQRCMAEWTGVSKGHSTRTDMYELGRAERKDVFEI